MLCHYKVLKSLKNKFDSPQSAGMFYFHQSPSASTQTESTSTLSQSVQMEDFGLHASSCFPNLHAMSIAFSKHCNNALNIEFWVIFLRLLHMLWPLLNKPNGQMLFSILQKVWVHDTKVTLILASLVEYITNFIAEDINTVSRCSNIIWRLLCSSYM